MFNFLNIEPKSFGLDFSDLSLKIIKLKRKDKELNLSSWGETILNPGIIEEGEIKNKEELINAIKKVVGSVKGKKLETRNVIASLPERKAFLQIIQMPKMSEEELKTAVPFEAENYIPLSIDDVYLDFQVIPDLDFPAKKQELKDKDKKNNQNILVAAFPKKIVDSYLDCLKKSGLIVQALEIESQSIVRVLIKNGISSFPLFIIDFGKSTTSFIFFSGRSIYSTSSVPVCSQDITESISKLLGVNKNLAEKLKIKYGISQLKMSKISLSRDNDEKKEEDGKNGKTEGEKVSEAIIPILDKLLKETKKHFDYYYTHTDHANYILKDNKIRKVILCGRGSNLKGVADFLSFGLGIPVEIGNPWINILSERPKNIPGISYEDSLGYTTALGLALRGIEKA